MDESQRAEYARQEAAHQAHIDVLNHEKFCPNCNGSSPLGGNCNSCLAMFKAYERDDVFYLQGSVTAIDDDDHAGDEETGDDNVDYGDGPFYPQDSFTSSDDDDHAGDEEADDYDVDYGDGPSLPAGQLRAIEDDDYGETGDDIVDSGDGLLYPQDSSAIDDDGHAGSEKTGRKDVEYGALHRHHIFPVAFKDKFEAQGVYIDQFVVTMYQFQHSLLHTTGWNSDWNMFFEMYREAGVEPGVDDIMDYGEYLMDKYGFPDAVVHPYWDKCDENLGPYI